MSFWNEFREPSPEDYDTEEEYNEDLDAYEREESYALDVASDRYYEEKYGG